MKLSRFLLYTVSLSVLALTLGIIIHTLVMPRIVHRNKEIRVPDILEYNIEEAKEVAVNADLELTFLRSEPHSDLPVGSIIEQYPEAGLLVRQGRVLTVVVSDGPPASTVPVLAGLSQRKAEGTLQRESFRVGDVKRLYHVKATTSEVAWQYPKSGSRVQKGKAVDMVIADPTLTDVFCMPDLSGQTLFSARAKIELAGCVIAPVAYERHPDLPPNTVVSQRPISGSRIRKGETVELVGSTR